MAKIERALPEYEKPPVSEVALSVEFLPLESWTTPHAGIFWESIAGEYPRVEIQPPLPSQIERFDKGAMSGGERRFQMMTGYQDDARVWFLNESGTDLVQVQRDHFVVNWRKVKGDERYPRYESTIRPRFVSEWTRLQKFLADRELGNAEVTQCEITYVNDVAQGEGWETIADVVKVFGPLSPRRTAGFLPPLETVSVGGSFVLPDERGRMHFSLRHVRRSIDEREVMQLKLTVRGRPDGGDNESVMRWFDIGREWIVMGFTDLTTPEAHTVWGRTR